MKSARVQQTVNSKKTQLLPTGLTAFPATPAWKHASGIWQEFHERPAPDDGKHCVIFGAHRHHANRSILVYIA